MASPALLSASPLYQHNAKLCLARIHRRIGNSSDGAQVRSAYTCIVDLIYKISFQLFPRCELLTMESERTVRATISDLQSVLDAFLDCVEPTVRKLDSILDKVEELGKKSKSPPKPSSAEWKRALKGVTRPSGKESRLFLDLFNLYWAGIYEPYMQACDEEPDDNIRHLDDVLPSLTISLQQMRKHAQSIDSMAFEVLRIYIRSTTAEERAWMLNEVDLEPCKLSDDQISPLDLNFRSPMSLSTTFSISGVGGVENKPFASSPLATHSNSADCIEQDKQSPAVVEVDPVEEPLYIKTKRRPVLPPINTSQPPISTFRKTHHRRPAPIIGPSPASSSSSQTTDAFPTSGDLSDIESIRQRLAAVMGHGSQGSSNSVFGPDADDDSGKG
ncbi:hypothetical protein MBLNU457_4922t1 [Dothideomycetes sp. NU457]